MNVFSAIGTIFNTVICYPLGAVIKFFFNFTSNYALLLLLFTVVVRFFLFPLAIKQQRSSAEMLRMKPKMEKIQKKYAKDQTKLQAEMQKLYAEEGYNPLAGCLPLLIQLPILWGLYQVVYYPLKYIQWFSDATVTKIGKVLYPFIKADYNIKLDNQKIQLYLAEEMKNHADKLHFLGHFKNIDFNLIGINLSETPTIGFSILLLIPILCYVSQALSAFLSFRMNKQVQAGQPGGGATNMMMVFLLPIMSVWLSVTLPAAVGFYWILSNVLMIGQTMILQKYFSLNRLAEQAQVKAEQRRQDIADGKIKPGRMAQLQKQAMEMQKQKLESSGNSSELQTVKGEPEQLAEPEIKIKVNSKGNKSRSQIKDEQRRRLASSREKKED